MHTKSKSASQVFSSGTRHEASRRNVSRVSRRDALEAMLLQMRDQELARLEELARTETRHDALALPDDLDNARSQEDLDVHISLIDLAESRLRAAMDALARLEQGEFGICPECGDEISFERLRAVPMAARCIDCQQALEGSARSRMTRGSNSISVPALFDAYQSEPRSSEPGAEDGAPIAPPERVARRRGASARR